MIFPITFFLLIENCSINCRFVGTFFYFDHFCILPQVFNPPPLFINTFYFFNIKESVKKGQSSHLEKNQYYLIMWGYFLWGTMKPIINDIAIYFFCLLRIFDVLTLNYIKIMTYCFIHFLGILWSIQELFLWSCCEFGGSIMIGRFLWNFVYI